MIEKAEELFKLIENKKARIVIIGMGHVGLPEAVAFAKVGFKVVGYDTDKAKTEALNQGRSHVVDVKSEELKELIKSGRFRADSSPAVLSRAHVKIIAVPTLLTKHKNPDVVAVTSVAHELAHRHRRPALIILESTGPPGVTDEVIKSAFDEKGLKPDTDYWLACSPARIDPGNPEWALADIPKIVGGLTRKSADLTEALYSRMVTSVVRASSPKAAEMTKLLENSFRAVNIAFIDQMHMICYAMGLDIWEIIKLASTKPFGFVPFFPGPGPGGECIPVDPFYVAWKAREHEVRAHFIELAGETMDTIPGFFVRNLSDLLNDKGKPLKGAKVLLLGVAYKKNVEDISRSPAHAIVELLGEHGAKVSYHDPFVPDFRTDGQSLHSVPLNDKVLRRQDAVMVVTDHSNVDYKMVVKSSPLILDARNALAEYKSAKIHR